MAYGDKKEAWEASVNISPAEWGSSRPALLTADRDDHLMSYVKDNLARESDTKSELFILKDGPVTLQRTGQRYQRWLYYKRWDVNGKISGYYIYDNGSEEEPYVQL